MQYFTCLKDMVDDDTKLETCGLDNVCKKSFYIPAYQRGYRWTDVQVKTLCKDIMDHVGGRYCLQQLVVRKRTETIYEVIDGQQRLTTLSILKAAINDVERPSIEYETREGSKDFLYRISKCEEESGMNKVASVDYDYMKAAYKCCKNWLTNDLKDDTMRERFKCNLKNCFFIWYEIKTDPYEAFQRLNSGKIALTNTELIKALLLNKGLFSNEDSINCPIIAEKGQLERSLEWDEMIRMFEHDDFWHFICPSNKLNKYKLCHADYLFHLVTNKSPDEKNPYALFEYVYDEKQKGTTELNELWIEIRKHYNYIKHCFLDKELYHLIGFCVDLDNNIIRTLINPEVGPSYSYWIKHLKSIIKNGITKKIEKRNELSDNTHKWINKEEFKKELKRYCDKLSYPDDNDEIKRILLLFNITTLLNEKSIDVRYPFHEYKNQEWSLEHIHARQEKPGENVKNYIEAARKLWKEENAEEVFYEKIENLCLGHNREELKNKSDDELCELLKGNENIFDLFQYNGFNYETSMGNLALLPKRFNSELSNKPFIDKKEIIKDKFSNEMIPICTRNAFFKFYSPKDSINVIWHYKNAIDYIANLANTITEYLFSEYDHVH